MCFTLALAVVLWESVLPSSSFCLYLLPHSHSTHALALLSGPSLSALPSHLYVYLSPLGRCRGAPSHREEAGEVEGNRRSLSLAEPPFAPSASVPCWTRQVRARVYACFRAYWPLIEEILHPQSRRQKNSSSNRHFVYLQMMMCVRVRVLSLLWLLASHSRQILEERERERETNEYCCSLTGRGKSKDK